MNIPTSSLSYIMSFKEDVNSRLWSINWRLVHAIISNYFYAQSELALSETKIIEPDGLFSFMKPTQKIIEIDRNTVKKTADQETELYYYDFIQRLDSGHIEQLKTELNELYCRTNGYKQTFQSKWKAASDESMRMIESKVSQLVIAKDVAQFTRDASVTFIGVAAGPAGLSASASLGVLAGTSFAKGAFNFQDNGDVGEAILEGSGNFVLGLIPITRGAMGANGVKDKIVEEGTKIIFGTTFETSKAMMDGNSLSNALTKGVLISSTDAIMDRLPGVFFNAGYGKDLLKNVPIPVKISVEFTSEVLKTLKNEEIKKKVNEIYPKEMIKLYSHEVSLSLDKDNTVDLSMQIVS